MWLVCLILSVGSLLLSAAFLAVFSHSNVYKKHRFNLFNALFACVFVSALLLFLPIHGATADTAEEAWRAILLSVFNSMQVFAIGCEFGVVTEGMVSCPVWLYDVYQVWASVLFVLAPVFTFGFVLSLFKNLSAYLKYLWAFRRDAYIFSELNEKSVILARDLKNNHRRAVIVFTDVFESGDERNYELLEAAKKLGAICFKKDVLVIDFKKHASSATLSFFAIGEDETENLNHALKLIERYRSRAHSDLYVFATGVESELLLTAVDKGCLKVRRINEVQSLVNRLLYEQGHELFDNALPESDGTKRISAVVVGMGRHGTELVKALAWYGQMDGYKLEINAFDRDPLAKERFVALAPELMSPHYNGICVDGEAQYTIHVHAGVDVETDTFAKRIFAIRNATYVVVALGDDSVNIKTAVNLRMYFERMGIHPVIHAIVYRSEQKKALEGIKNYRGQAYDISFIGDTESACAENVLIDSELEEAALRRHLKWGKEEEFWTYEYNYRSSMASAIHMKARIHCGVMGADKKEEELTEQERRAIETLEHRRWNAYMRAEGYVFSGSKDKSSRNDLAKMHHDLVDFDSLTEEEKRKDSSVGTE